MKGLAAACALIVGAAPRAAWAFDAEVRADTQTQAYQVRGAAGAPLLSLRRLSQTLTLYATERPSSARGVTWAIRARLRVDSDFGTACDPGSDRCLDELNRSRAAEFAPLFARRSLDLPWAYVEAQGILAGAVDVRLGRQLLIDPLGFFLFDGVRARATAFDRVVFEAYGGLETRTGFALSNGRYERDGAQRANREAWSDGLASQVRDRSLAGALGLAVETAGESPLFARVSWRRVWSEEGVAEDKLGATIDLTLGAGWRAYTEGVFSIPQQALASLVVGGAWSDRAGRVVGLELSRWRPTFDLTTVWASFWTDPTDDARLRGELPLGRGFTLLGALAARRFALSEGAAAPGAPPLADAWSLGGDAGVALRRERHEGSLRAHVERGDVGTRAGADLTSRWWVRWQVVRLDASLSAWWVEDAQRSERDLASVGLMVGALVRTGRVADVQVNFEDDVNRLVGHRLRAVVSLTLRIPY